MRLNLKESLVYSVSDPSWMSKALKWLLAYIGMVTMPIMIGYYLETVRRVAQGDDEELPSFQNLGKMWKQGFFCYLGMVFAILPLAGLNMMVFITVLQRDDPSAVFLPFFVIHMALCLGFGLLAPAMVLRYAMTEQVRSMWKLKELWSDLRQGTGDYLMISIGFPFLASLAMGVLSLTGVGVVFVFLGMPLMAFAHAHLLGNYYRCYFQ